MRTILALLLLIACPSALPFDVLRSSLDGTPYTWPQGHVVTWKTTPGSPPMLREAVMDAATKWSEAAGWAIVFSENEQCADVVFHWDWSGEGIDPYFLGYAWVSMVEGAIKTGDVVINGSDYDWYRGAGGVRRQFGRQAANLDAVVLHEMGHIIGIGHANDNAEEIVGGLDNSDLPTMWFVQYPKADTLHADDAAAVQFLYPGGSGTWVPQEDQEPLEAWVVTPQKRVVPRKFVWFQAFSVQPVRWYFGDGSSRRGAKVRHKFRRAGLYVVTAVSGSAWCSMLVVVGKKPR